MVTPFYSNTKIQTHTGPVAVSPWTFPSQLVLVPIWKRLSNPGSDSTKGPRVLVVQALCPVRTPLLSLLPHAAPGGWGGDREEPPKTTNRRWYLQTASVLCFRVLLMMTWDTVGRRKGWTDHCRGMRLSRGEFWIRTVWPREQTEGLLLPRYTYCAVFREGHVATGEYRWVNIYLVNASAPCDPKWVEIRCCNFVLPCVHSA